MKQALNFTGTGVAIVTPFTAKGAIDFPALTKLVEHLIKGRVEYIVVMGTTGETATLSKEEKEQVIAHIVKTNKKRLPLVLGVGGNNTAELVEQLKKNKLSDFDAILSVSPYYNKPSQEGIYQHYKAISKASPLPIILYNVPGRTASNIAWDTTIRLANEFKNIIAVKEASGNMEQIMKIIKHRPDNFLIISGDDNLTLPIIASGGDGVISVVANAYPKDFSDMVRSALVHDLKTAQKLHYKLMEITEQLFADGNPGGVKVVLAQKKITLANVRLPLVEPNDTVKAKLKKIAY
ncbi:MAG: dihydrodipicolinate synthase [Bacteroidota bacterium]|jgi:4-hydroxy-tetrahydrodipicolinate synthase|nr:dihydrodipicolinate synthase [Bacteroidota bacterium]